MANPLGLFLREIPMIEKIKPRTKRMNVMKGTQHSKRESRLNTKPVVPALLDSS